MKFTVFPLEKTNGEAAIRSDLSTPRRRIGDPIRSVIPSLKRCQSGASSASASALEADPLVPSGKGKSIATGNAGDVIPSKTWPAMKAKLQFRLIHFWEAWNSLTKVLIGIEMLLIDEEDRRSISTMIGSVIRGYKEFDAACDMKGALYDYVGHIKLVNGQVPNDGLCLHSLMVNLSHELCSCSDPVLKLCLWDKAASEFCEKFRASGGAARVILVTTLNPKRFGVLSLSSMTPTRVFLDGDVQETRDYLSWLNSNLEVANKVKPDVVVKPEPASLGELFAYMKQSSAKVAWFECTATIDDVVHDSRWYYIGCGECHTKATKGATTLMCKKCGKDKIVGVPQYLARLSVYDNKDQAVFVVLGDAGEELFGKKASDLVESYYQANESVGADHIVPVPQAMVDTIGQTRKFIVKDPRPNQERVLMGNLLMEGRIMQLSRLRGLLMGLSQQLSSVTNVANVVAFTGFVYLRLCFVLLFLNLVMATLVMTL
ncbi:hypothetical protein Bca52824_010447 [Brassica carinata]|uniref:Replication factor A C-terminal domain-containing protein n=1 Tax=Brassica carinata TaxID=52824 RepID=A0A8X7WBS0_BRACI|nr:hypothetical protein Bca52824_010447 [Brassica carinata]